MTKHIGRLRITPEILRELLGVPLDHALSIEPRNHLDGVPYFSFLIEGPEMPEVEADGTIVDATPLYTLHEMKVRSAVMYECGVSWNSNKERLVWSGVSTPHDPGADKFLSSDFLCGSTTI